MKSGTSIRFRFKIRFANRFQDSRFPPEFRSRDIIRTKKNLQATEPLSSNPFPFADFKLKMQEDYYRSL
jgi:hypothetical protein